MSSIERNAIQKMAILDETPLIVRLSRAEMYPDPGQPRKKRSQQKLEGLAQTMLVKQLQPCLVRQVDGRDGYMIVIGEGRWLAAGINEEKQKTEQYLDCILVDETNIGKIRAMQLVENLQREEMNEMHVARGYLELIELGECRTGKDVSNTTGVSEGTVSVYLKVARGPEEIQELVELGIATMDTARTLMMLAELNKERADALVQAGLDSGMLKRSSVRDAYAEEKTRAENAAATAEAAHEAAQQQEGNNTGADAQQQDPVATPGHPEPQGTSEVQPSASANTVQEPQQKAKEAAPQAFEGGGKGDIEKAPETAPKAAPQPAAEAAKPSPAPAAPVLQQPRNEAAPEAPADSPLVVAEKFDVLVSIRSGTPDEERFITLNGEYGNARLASHIVHREPSRAWVQFGKSKEHEQLQAFNCGDLEIVKVIQRA